MDFDAFKKNARAKIRPIVLGLDRLGVTPLGISITGLAITALAGWIIARGSFFGGAIVFLLGSAFDMLDGDLARLQGTVSKRGAFLDSCFDRFGEAFVFAGLTWHYATRPGGAHEWALLLILLTVVGSLATSYVRARAEGVGETCFVGWLQRTERVILLGVGLLLGHWALLPILWFLAVATLATSVQRLIHVARKLPGPGAERPATESVAAARPESDPAPPTGEDG